MDGERGSPGLMESELIGDMGEPDVKDISLKDPGFADMGEPDSGNLSSTTSQPPQSIDYIDLGQEEPISPQQFHDISEVDVIDLGANLPEEEQKIASVPTPIPPVITSDSPKNPIDQLRERLFNSQPIPKTQINSRRWRGVPSTRRSSESVPVLKREPRDDLKRQAFATYERYFGPNWQENFQKYLLIQVRSATPADWQRVRAERAVGYVATTAETTNDEDRIVANHIQFFQQTSPYALLTEVGESVYNVLENVAVTGSVPEIAQGYKERLENGDSKTSLVDFSRQILDRWDQAYRLRPARYSGINPNDQREYKGIPVWKSEGFSDGIALEVKRRAGESLNPAEQSVWDSFGHYGQDILRISTDLFVPPVQVK